MRASSEEEVKAMRDTWNNTQREMMQWGMREIELRKRDLTDRTPEGLQRAKTNATERRLEIELTTEQASMWMREARKALKQGKVQIEVASNFRALPSDVPTTATGDTW